MHGSAYVEYHQKGTETMEDQAITILRKDIKGRTIKLYSYAALLTVPGPGHEVRAVRMDGYENKLNAMKEIWKQFPGAKIKTISKLYKSDFEEDQNG